MLPVHNAVNLYLYMYVSLSPHFDHSLLLFKPRIWRVVAVPVINISYYNYELQFYIRNSLAI